MLLCLSRLAQASIEPSQVLILVNRDQAISERVASMYQKFRAIPAENILRLSLGSDRNLTPDAYWQKAGAPLRQYLESHPSITCVVTTSGVPYTIQAPDGEGIAFDNELAAVLQKDPADRRHSLPNPLYLGATNLYGATDARALKMIFVSRLDGPDLATITRMVEDAIAVEKTGLTGPVFGDAQGIDGITGYGLGDFSIRSATDLLAGAGFKATLDMKQESWKQPKGGVGDQAAGAAFYVGWYDLLNFQDIFGEHGLARGSIAWHIASQEAQNIWDGNGWCLGLMRHGAAVTLGPVREPYVAAFPHGDVFTQNLIAGASVGESYWLALPQISWAMVLLGDPMYRPFALNPRPALVARAYLADNEKRILQKGETAALLVEIECIGPAGSSTPPMIAKTVAEMGLAAASGPVTVPALRAGESTIVRIPSVTAGSDPTGMFRLHLEVQDGTPNPRRIVLEGRTGFSRLTGGVTTKAQMFVSPNGSQVVSGLPGRTLRVSIATLEARPFNAPRGFLIAAVDFSPDGDQMAVNLYDPQRKSSTVLITDATGRGLEFLPSGSQFLRWLDPGKVLMKTGDRLVGIDVGSLAEQEFDISGARSGNVMRGTGVLMLTTADGKLGFKKGTEPFNEVLQGVKISGSAAIADDLTMFGAVDTEKRLWVQHGVDEKPEIVASGVEKALWGPISHRVLIEGTDKKSRVYDGRDRSWVDIGTVTAAVWSPDEERLLFLESAGPSERYLSVLSGRTVQRICSLDRIGNIAKIEISDKKDWAFLLAGLSSQANVWMLPLPPM